MRSATMVDGRRCYGDDDHTRRRSRSVARARWSCVLVQSAEQRHQSRWHMKKEARTDEGARRRSRRRRRSRACAAAVSTARCCRRGGEGTTRRSHAWCSQVQPEGGGAAIEGRGGGGGPRASGGRLFYRAHVNYCYSAHVNYCYSLSNGRQVILRNEHSFVLPT